MENKKRAGPREKVQQQGIASLSTAELLQVIVGSGNSYVGMAKIARKTLRLLSKYGRDVTYAQLCAVPGLGPARACQLLAVFEIAVRYTPSVGRRLLDTADKTIQALSDLRSAQQDSVMVVMLDGGHAYIATRLFHGSNRHSTELLRSIFTDILRDGASKVIIGSGSATRGVTPTIFDLSFARDAFSMAKLCQITIRDFYIINEKEEFRVDVGVSH